MTVSRHFEKSLLLVNQCLHFRWILFWAFKNLLSSTSDSMASTSKMRWFVCLRSIFLVSFIKSITHIVLMIRILWMDIELLPAIRTTKCLSIVVDPSIHTLVETRTFWFMTRFLERLSLLSYISFCVVLLLIWIGVILLRMLLKHQLFVFIFLHHINYKKC